MIETLDGVLKEVSDSVLHDMHHDSMQQGAEYMYFCVQHELEWDVHEKKVTRKYANELLKKLAEDINVTPQTVKISKIPLWYAMTPYRRRIKGE